VLKATLLRVMESCMRWDAVRILQKMGGGKMVAVYGPNQNLMMYATEKRHMRMLSVYVLVSNGAKLCTKIQLENKYASIND